MNSYPAAADSVVVSVLSKLDFPTCKQYIDMVKEGSNEGRKEGRKEVRKKGKKGKRRCENDDWIKRKTKI